MDSSSSLQRRRPAPLHLHSRLSADASAHSNGSSSPSTTGPNGADEGIPASAPMSMQMSEDGQSQRGSFSNAGPAPGASGYLSPYGGGNYPPPSLPHSHSMPIPTSVASSGFASGQGYSTGAYTGPQGPPYSASSATFGGTSITASHAAAAPYSSTASSFGAPEGPGALTHTQSAPAVPLSAGLSTGPLPSSAYPGYSSQQQYATGLSSYRSSQSGPSSSPYGYHLHTPHYQPFAYGESPSGTSPYDRSNFAQQQQRQSEDHYRSVGVTASGQRYPPFAPKVPLVDRPFKCDECVQSFVRRRGAAAL